MIKIDEDALICDLAETYQIYDYRQLPASTVAVFSCGLRHSSRIKMALSNQDLPLETLLLAGLHDKVSLLLWSKTKDAQNGENRPTSMLESLIRSTAKEQETIVFDTGKDFEQARNELLKNMAAGGDDYGD